MIAWIKQKYKTIDNFIKKNLTYSLNQYISLVSGILGGGIIGFSFSFSLNIKGILLNLFIIGILFYIMGLFIINQNLKDNRLKKIKYLKDYHLSLFINLIASAYIGIVIWAYINFKFRKFLLIDIISLTGLVILFFILLYLFKPDKLAKK